MTSSTNSAGAGSRPRRRLWTTLGIGLLILITLCVLIDSAGRTLVDSDDSDDPVSGTTEVSVVDNDFEPSAIEVPVGTTVTWRWEGDNPHNVVGDEFESPVQEEGTFAHTFTDAGTHDYQCTLHAGMRGEVVVTEDPST